METVTDVTAACGAPAGLRTAAAWCAAAARAAAPTCCSRASLVAAAAAASLPHPCRSSALSCSTQRWKSGSPISLRRSSTCHRLRRTSETAPRIGVHARGSCTTAALAVNPDPRSLVITTTRTHTTHVPCKCHQAGHQLTHHPAHLTVLAWSPLTVAHAKPGHQAPGRATLLTCEGTPIRCVVNAAAPPPCSHKHHLILRFVGSIHCGSLEVPPVK
jgi:hypothetical protein